LVTGGSSLLGCCPATETVEHPRRQLSEKPIRADQVQPDLLGLLDQPSGKVLLRVGEQARTAGERPCARCHTPARSGRTTGANRNQRERRRDVGSVALPGGADARAQSGLDRCCPCDCATACRYDLASFLVMELDIVGVGRTDVGVATALVGHREGDVSRAGSAVPTVGFVALWV
jgi:hypothetical protein